MNQDTQNKIFSLITFGMAVMGLMYLIFTKHLLSTNIIGVIVQVLAAGLMIWARITFGTRSFHAMANTTEGGLVTNGPYRLLRHPIYAAIIYFTWVSVFSYPFLDVVAAVVIISASLILRGLLEEKFLKVAYEDYKTYSKHAYRLIPFVF